MRCMQTIRLSICDTLHILCAVPSSLHQWLHSSVASIQAIFCGFGMYFCNIDQSIMSFSSMTSNLANVSQISPTPRPARYLYITSIVNVYSKNCIFPALHTVAQILQAVLVGPKAVYKLEILNYRLCCVISSSHFLTASLSTATDHWLLN